jgi:hypothetical protein
MGFEIPSVSSIVQEATDAVSDPITAAKELAEGIPPGALDSAIAATGMGALAGPLKNLLSGNTGALADVGSSRFPAKPPRQG